MDFRDPNIVGTFLYHCHILKHEDMGLMGVVQVLPPGLPTVTTLKAPAGVGLATGKPATVVDGKTAFTTVVRRRRCARDYRAVRGRCDL